MAQSGTLTLEYATAGSLVLRFTPASTFSTGTLEWHRSDTGALTSQAIVSGLTTLSSLPGGTRVSAFALSYNGAGALLGNTIPLFLTAPAAALGTDEPFKLEWRTDRQDWDEQDLGSELQRVSIPFNKRGFWHQLRVTSYGQNVRLIISDIRLHMRVHGKNQEMVQ